MYTKINRCRICGNTQLTPVLDLGNQMLTGIFPSRKDANITTGPLKLVKCTGNTDCCGLLQLEHSYNLSEMYGMNYGYRSGLNPSMVTHLHDKVKRIYQTVSIQPGDLIVDIGSNDSTTLQAYKTPNIDLIGIDPTGVKFHSYYPDHIQLIPDFFSASLLRENFPDRQAKVITSFSMFYDLERPMDFMHDVYNVLSDDGIWVFEQSYMPTMLKMNSYDTVCHEHLEYYSLHQIKWMTDRVGFRILDVQFNEINGGSFSITVSKSETVPPISPKVIDILNQENADRLDTLRPYYEFADRISSTKQQLRAFIEKAKSEGKTIAALGASTKGNVILQYCGITPDEISSVGEVNSEKFGCFTPGTWLPILPEDQLLLLNPDYLLILPWHFKRFFEKNPKFSGLKLVTPLPEVTLLA